MARRPLSAILLLTALVTLSAVMYQQYLRGRSADSQPQASNPPVIVVGSGLAGLCAAYTALTSGAEGVCLLERSSRPGGNSIKASSGISGAPTQFQRNESGNDDSFLADTIRSAGGRLAGGLDTAATSQRTRLISILTDNSAEAIDFLVGLGVDLSVVTQLGGHSYARTHRGAGKTPPGQSIVTTLLKRLESEYGSRFELKMGCEVTKLLTERIENDADHISHPSIATLALEVTGVEYKEGNQVHSLRGPVIFATGGFAGDTHGLLAQHRPDLSGLPSTNEPRPGAHKLLSEVGARLVDMESVQIHPTGFVDPANPQTRLKFLAAEMLRGEGGILLYKGKRFVNELDTREQVSKAIMNLAPSEEGRGNEKPPLRQWDVQLLLDPGAADAAAGHVGFYLWKGLLQKKRVSELDTTTQATLREYASIVASEGRAPADRLGRRQFGHWKLGVAGWDDDAEVCIGRVTPIVHFTMGGVVMNEHAQVLSSELGQEQRPIPGLWAAGEITGGIHGDNRLGGSSLLECVVYGRIAGKAAAETPKNGLK